MMHFFGWPGGGINNLIRGDDAPASGGAVDRGSGVCCEGQLPARRCAASSSSSARPQYAACDGPGALALLRPFGRTLQLLAETGDGPEGQASNSAKRALSAATRFLAPCSDSERHLEFVLGAHTSRDTTRKFFDSVREALEALQEAAHSSSDPAVFDAELVRWNQEETDFRERCREVWEVFLYFTFLDVKGDRALLEVVARRLCRLLGGLPARSLLTLLSRTRPWAEEALRLLAGQHVLPLLERLHTETLREWFTEWEDRIKKTPDLASFAMADEEEPGSCRGHPESPRSSKFWETFFTHFFKITWPDFVEAFERFYLFGRCPVDLTAQLRVRMDPSCRQQVSRSRWHDVMQEFGKVVELVRTLICEVCDDVAPRIYRPEPLRPSDSGHGPAELDANDSLARKCDGLALPEATPASSDTASMQSLPSPLPLRQRCPVAGPKPKPWFPFAHVASDDGDMAIPTPHEQRFRQGTAEQVALEQQAAGVDAKGEGKSLSWDGLVAGLCAQTRPWWLPQPAVGSPEAVPLEDASSSKPLQLAALRTVSSTVAYTQRAMIFRVVSGELAQNQPLLESPKKNPAEAAGEGADAPALLHPALVIMANGTRFPSVTKFGRSSSRKTLLPDHPMSEPIASRSHFNVVYEQDSDRYSLMDAGSKWGTFVKIGSSVVLSCGDWLRVGGVEFIIRFCGGGCACRKRHAHYRLHSLRLLRDHYGAASGWATPVGTHRRSLRPACGNGGPTYPEASLVAQPAFGHAVQPLAPNDAQSSKAEAENSSEDERAPQFQDELLLLLSSRRPRCWTTAPAQLCQQSALRNSHSTDYMGGGADGFGRQTSQETATTSQWPLRKHPQVPIAPLELDFISGPRMGEKLVLCERVCTLGRGEGNTIQVSDSHLASVSRVHCIFEYVGNRWYMRDNGSTNGTWRRLSCVLEPSEPVPLADGVSIQAGVHEFIVEEVEMRTWWTPSAATAALGDMCEQEEHREQTAGIPDAMPSADG